MIGSTGPERIWASDDGEATAFTPLPYVSIPVGGATFSTNPVRHTTASIFPRRLSSASAKESRTSDSMFSGRNILATRSNDKGKTPLRGDTQALGNGGMESLNNHPFATYDRVRPSTASSSAPSSGFNSRKNRNSILGAASDALSFKFGRKSRPVVRQPTVPIVLPDVIEISAPPPDQEVEERNRLREMAAQAIGISPFLVHPDSYSQEESTEDEDDDVLRTPADTSELRRFGDTRNSESVPDIRNKSFLETSSITTTHHPMRYRSGSVASHSRQNSIVVTPIPPFPTNVLALNPFLACSAYFPKYTPPSSLRRFALSSKNWKTRYIILSTPTNLHNPLSRNPSPAVSYLHVFKSSGPDDKELERLEIHTESAVFVADEEVGGRPNVIRIKGFESVAGKSSKSSNGTHDAIWQVHIIDPVESQKWITAIKNAILGQRTLAAGLGIPTTPTTSEPRGDLDVIMKIRTQGLSASRAPQNSPLYEYQPPRSPTDRNYASSVSSQSVHSQSTVPKPTGTVSALKTLFSSRPRSGSKATAQSSDAERQQTEREHTEESFASMGNNLLGMLRSGTPDNATINTPISQRSAVPFTPYPTPLDRSADRKVLAERQGEQWVNRSPPVVSDVKTRANRALSLGALSLQPPPRKRWTSLRPTSGATHDELGRSPLNTENVVTEAFGPRPSTDKAETEPPSSPLEFNSFSMTSYDQRLRAPSVHSVETHGSENTGRSSTSTKRSSSTNKRWSRQLPPRQTPPSGPPPVIPAAASLTQLAHPYNPDRPPSVTSSQQSVVSRLPAFYKRASTSSTHSVKSSSTKDSAASSSSARRLSMPPPQRPPPTTALPLTPSEETPSSRPVSSKSFRNSMAQRAMRLSLIAPKPPPSTNLPPRPDEIDYSVNTSTKHHRMSSSSVKSQTLDSIPEPSQHHPYMATVGAPFPPPMAPLPPTPRIGEATPTQPSSTPTASRHSSLKQRLRILSAPSPSSGSSELPSSTSSPLSSSVNSRQATTSSSMAPNVSPIMQFNTQSTPNTPTTERNMDFNNDATSFLHMNNKTPTPSNFVPLRLFEQSNYINPQRHSQEVAVPEVLGDVAPLSLSPPPRNRRGSQQMIPTILVPIEQEESSSSIAPSLVTTLTPPTTKIAAQSPSILSQSSSIYDDHDHEDDREDDDLVQYDDDFSENGQPNSPDDDLITDVLDGMLSGRHKVAPRRKVNHADPSNAFALPPHGSVVSLGHVSL
ncbi:hypothetical protein DFP72DRAFT_891297 [Ephemerocybe angulata]|uniref:PH domain-containing protein n=1 Tax=Ephemerocybe angulata TaxID=980116 RepID=A0A8H6I236_9AGAR|nr:hypothetical protein DFP72DRAFT_891297 [Tulosesus angulatus]